MAFDAVCEPGAYVCHWSGHLMRIGPEAIGPGRFVIIVIVACRSLMVTKISDDPTIGLNAARVRAANHDLYVRF